MIVAVAAADLSSVRCAFNWYVDLRDLRVVRRRQRQMWIRDSLTAANEIDRSHLGVAAVLGCAATAGIFLSGPLRHVVDRRGAAQAVYAVGALGAVTLLVRSLT